MSTVAAVVLTLNEQRHISDCVSSVRWADRVIVLDTLSTDDTVDLARAAGAEVMQHAFENYAQIRNVALDLVEATWLFFVDADERATPQLADEVRQVTNYRPENGWWVPRHNIIFGRLTRGAGWYPDHQMRLLRRGHAHYQRPVHEIVALDGAAGFLANPLLHYNYDNVAQFRAKQSRYTQFGARILHAEGVRARWYTPFTQAIRHFGWRYWTLAGYREGGHGLRLCLLMAWYEAAKYHQLRRIR